MIAAPHMYKTPDQFLIQDVVPAINLLETTLTRVTDRLANCESSVKTLQAFMKYAENLHPGLINEFADWQTIQVKLGQ